jgi:uncharacterized membrane protein YoaK (UPF0700 family)
VIPPSTSLPVALLLTASNGYLDAYTYLAHDGVFATSQTGNIVLAFVGLTAGRSVPVLPHVWPILTFAGGVALAAVLRPIPGPRVVIASLLGQAAILTVIGLLPATVPAAAITSAIGFVAGLQLGLFRLVACRAFITVASTGNLLRLVEAVTEAACARTYRELVTVGFYATIIAGFAVGVGAGAVLTDLIGSRSCLGTAAAITVAAALVRREFRRGRPDYLNPAHQKGR